MMSGLEGRFLALIKNLEEEKRLADKRAKQLFDLIANLPQTYKTTAKARAYLSSTQYNIPDNTVTKVLLDAETYDPGGNFDADGVDSEFIAPVPGYYGIKGQVHWTSAPAGSYRSYIYINGANKVQHIIKTTTATSYVSNLVSDVLPVGLGESIDLRCKQMTGVATGDISGAETLTYLTIHLLSL